MQIYQILAQLSAKGIKDDFNLENGEKITLVFAKSDPGGFSLIPKMKRFDVRGDFSSGLIAYDRAYIYANIDDLAANFRL